MGVGAVTVSHVTGSPRGSYVLDKQEPPTRIEEELDKPPSGSLRGLYGADDGSLPDEKR